MREEIIGNCRLILGDCMEVMTSSLSAMNALISDPPYGVNMGQNTDKRRGRHGLGRETYGSYEDTQASFDAVVVKAIEIGLVLTQRGAVFSTKNIAQLPAPDAVGAVYLPAATGRHCWGFNSLALVALYGTAPGLNHGAKSTVLRSVETAESNGHPCPKPLGWMRWLVDLASQPSEIVFDPFMGSGTTGVACAKMGRRFVGIEIDPTYFDIACRRIEAAYAQPDLFVERPAKPQQLHLSVVEG